MTSWGCPEREIDPRTLRRYCALLSRLLAAGEAAFFVLLTLVAVLSLVAVFLTNWENGIFYDGTDMVCIYDGASEQIYQVQ